MRAVILAAGRGSRLGSATDERPKCLVEVAGRPLLEHQLRALRGAGVDEIVIVTGYRADLIEARGLPTRHNADWAETNMVASLLCAADVIDGPTLVSYADIAYPSSFAVDVAQCDAPLAVAYDPDWLDLWQCRFDDPLEDAETFRLEHDRVVEIGGRPSSLEEIQGQYIGLLRLTPEALDRLRAAIGELGPKLDCTGALRHLIASGTDVRAVAVRGPWCEVDGARDLEVAEAVLTAVKIDGPDAASPPPGDPPPGPAGSGAAPW